MSSYWKQKLKEGPDIIWESSLDYVLFKLIGYHLEGGLRLKLDVQGQGVGRFLDVDEQGGWGLGFLKIG